MLNDVFCIRDKLFRFAARIVGSQSEAEDVVQDVFVKLWQQRDQLNGIKNLEAWSMTMTKNASLDHLRSKHRKTENIDLMPQIGNQASQFSAQQPAESKDMMQLIEKIMAKLPEKQRISMHLRDVEGMNYDEIADIQQITLAQVKTNIHRARTFVREKLEEIDW